MSRKLRYLLYNYLNSGWDFPPREYLQKYRFRLINSIFLVAFVALIQGIISNYIFGYSILMYADASLIVFFLWCIYLLRRNKKNYNAVTHAIAFVVLVHFNLLILFSKPEDIKLIWCFFYVVAFLFLKGNRVGVFWIAAFFVSLLAVQFQNIYPSYLSFGKTLYLIFVLAIIASTTYFFQRMIDKAYRTILKQNCMLEEQMQTIKRQEKMMIDQSRLAAMGEMTRMIAHQWRQPLSTASLRISNYQINAMLGKSETQTSDELLEEINETLSYLSHTINDFQDYFKPDNQLGCCDLEETIRLSIEFIAPRLKEYAIDMRLTCKPNILVKANSNELKQIFLNLFNNAVDAIIIAEKDERFIEVVCSEVDDKVFVEVHDTGIGIAQDVTPHLFEPYFSTKGKNGTGLGLYMVKMIVEQQFGGLISTKDRAEGAAFVIQLFKCDKGQK